MSGTTGDAGSSMVEGVKIVWQVAAALAGDAEEAESIAERAISELVREEEPGRWQPTHVRRTVVRVFCEGPMMWSSDRCLTLADEGTPSEMRRALAGLDDRSRDVLRLVDIACLGYAEAGRVLGLPAHAVADEVTRARARLRQAL